AAGIGGDPAAEGGEFDAVRLVTARQALLGQPRLQVGTGDAGLDAGAHVLAVDPLDGVHTAHVDGDDHALLVPGQLQGGADAGAAAVRNEADIVLGGQSHQRRRFLVRFGPDDKINDAVKVGVEHLVNLV